MDVYIYCADIYCEECGKAICERLTPPECPEDESTYDSDEYPKGPYANGGGEADYPQNCAGCGVFLENDLTAAGVDYVKELLREHRDSGRGSKEAVELWRDYYRGAGYDIDEHPEDDSVTLNSETLFPPVQIAPNLAAGVIVDGHWLTVEYADRPGRDGRTRYRWTVIFPDGRPDASDDDLQSGAGGGNLTQGLESFLAFLGAAAESRRYRAHKRELECDPDSNEALFPASVVEFAAQNSDEISMLQCEIEERMAE